MLTRVAADLAGVPLLTAATGGQQQESGKGRSAAPAALPVRPWMPGACCPALWRLCCCAAGRVAAVQQEEER